MLFVVAALLGIAATNAQGTGTFVVADGSETNEYVPVYGYYADSYLRCQTIYPASMLTEIVGNEIHGITYYLATTAVEGWGDASFEVKIGTVANASFDSDDPAWVSTSTLTTVYTGRLDATQSELTFYFTDPFTYTGGNLIIEVNNLEGGEYDETTFYGIESESASVQGLGYDSWEEIELDDVYDFIPKTGFIVPVACATPTFGNISSTETSITFDWTENGSATSWKYKLGDGEWTTVTTHPCTVNGLTTNTAYAISIISICGTDNESFPANTTFRTACPASFALPYADNFESYAAGSGNFPACWTSGAGSGYVQSNAGNNSDKALRFEESAVAATPVINVAGNNLLITFDLMSEYSYYAGSMVVGFAASPDALDNAVYLDTIDPDEEYNSYEYSFENTINLQSGCLVFKQIDDYASYYWTYGLWLDNLNVSVLSDCRRPESATVVDLTPNTASLTWTTATLASAYEVAYGTSSDVEQALATETATTNSITLSNLAPATTYYAWVRTVCGEERTLWRAVEPFTTEVACAPVTDVNVTSTAMTALAIGWTIDATVGNPSTAVLVSYKASDDTEYNDTILTSNSLILTGLEPGTTYNFRVRNICSTDSATVVNFNASTIGCGEIGDGSSNSGTLPTNCNYNYSYTQSIYTADEVGNIDTIHGISYNFASTTSTTRSVDVYIADVENASLQNGYIDISNFTRVATNYNWNLTEGWCSIPFSQDFIHQAGKDIVIAIDDNTGSFTYRYFKAHSGSSRILSDDDTNPDPASPDAGSVTPYAADIRFDVNCTQTCPAPLAIVGETAAHEVTLTWTPLGNETSWTVEYKATSDDEWTTYNNNVTTANCTITELDAATSYMFRIGANCGEETAYASVAAFTDCDVMNMPYSDGFEDYTADYSYFPQCWTNVSESSNYVDNTTSHVSAGANSLHLQGPAIITSPVINFNGGDIYVRFDLMREYSYSGSMAIGVAASPDDVASAIFFDTIVAPDGTYQNYEFVYTNTTNLQTGCIVFKQISTYSNYYYWLDEFYVSVPPTCIRLTDLQVDAVTNTTATISWTHDATNFEIRYRAANGDWQTATSTTASVTLTGLTPSTAYQFEVRAICSANDSSEAVAGTFRTECDAVSSASLPYFEGFEDDLACWSQQQIEGDLEWDSYNYYYSPLEGDNFINLSGNDYGVETRLISPVFDLSNVENVTLSFAHMQSDYSGDFDSLAVEYRLNSSDEWHQLALYNNAIEVWQTENIAIPQVSSTFQFAFHGYIEYGHGIVIDSLTLSGNTSEDPVCNVPTNVTTSNLTANTVTVSWTGTAAQYEIQITGGEEPIIVTTTSYTFQTLSPETSYTIQVRAICDNGLTSDWSAPVSITTPQPECGIPVNVQTATTSTSVTVTWIGYASEYDVIVSGGDMPIQRTVTTNSCTIEGLNPSSTYNVKVRAKCNGQYTDWTDPVTFYTAAGGSIDDVEGNTCTVTIYPNPATSQATVSVEGLSGKANVAVVDMTGRTVMTSTMESTCTINVSQLAAGTYFVRISGANIQTVRKLIVK